MVEQHPLFVRAVKVTLAFFFGILLGIIVLGVTSVAKAQSVDRTSTLSWGAVTTDSAGAPLSGVFYRVYRGRTMTDAKTKIADNVSVLTYVDTVPTAGQYCYYITAAALTASESVPSTTVCKTFPQAPAAQVQSLTIQ